jgi:hypothetical protein
MISTKNTGCDAEIVSVREKGANYGNSKSASQCAKLAAKQVSRRPASLLRELMPKRIVARPSYLAPTFGQRLRLHGLYTSWSAYIPLLALVRGRPIRWPVHSTSRFQSLLEKWTKYEIKGDVDPDAHDYRTWIADSR